MLIVGTIGWSLIGTSGNAKNGSANSSNPVVKNTPNGVPRGNQPQGNPQPGNRAAEPAREYEEGRDFSDGVAWVRQARKEGQWQFQWHCVDKTGKIVLSLEPSTTGNWIEEPESNFSHGVALVRRSGGPLVELIDKTGKVVSSPKSGEYDEIKGFIHDIGMIVVSKHMDTFQLTEDRAGIIDSNGNWKVPLTNDPVLVAATKIRHNSREILQDSYNISERVGVQGDLRYCGEGVFTLVQRQPFSTQTLFYNVLIGDKHTLPEAVATLSRIENGHGVYLARGAVNRIDKSGNTTEIIKFDQHNNTGAYLGKYAEGLLYFRVRGNIYNANVPDLVPAGFYDISGKRIVDLSKYKIDDYNDYDRPVFADVYCVMNVRNPQGVGYYTVIDKSGKEMFEPRNSPSYPGASGRNYIALSTKCGMVVIGENGSEYREKFAKWTIINVTGDIVAEFEAGHTISDYNEDATLVKKGTGEIYYIDKTGKRLW